MSRGVVAEWTGRIVRLENKTVIDSSLQPRYVGMPGMSAMAVDLAVGLCVRTGTQINAVTHSAIGWTIATEANETTDSQPSSAGEPDAGHVTAIGADLDDVVYRARAAASHFDA